MKFSPVRLVPAVLAARSNGRQNSRGSLAVAVGRPRAATGICQCTPLRCSRVVALMAAATLTHANPIAVHAATRTWGPNTLNQVPWSDRFNWVGDIAPVPGDDLFFGIANPNSINDYPAGTSFHDIMFGSSLKPYALTGNALTLTGNIINNNTNGAFPGTPMSLAFPIALQQDATFNAAEGNLSFTGGISGLSGTQTLTLSGAATSNSFIAGVIADGVATRLGISLTGGTWTLSGANSYSGGTQVNGGSLKLAPTANTVFGSNITGGGALVFAPASPTTTLTLSGDNSAFSGAITVFPGVIALPSDGALGSTTSTLTLTNNSAAAPSFEFPTLLFSNGARVLANPLRLVGVGFTPVIAGVSDVTLNGSLLNATATGGLSNQLAAGATLNLNGPIYLSGTASKNTFAVTGTGQTIINGNIENSIVTALQDSVLSTGSPGAAGVTIVNSTSLNYTGGTNVVAGTTIFNVAGVLPPARNLKNTANVYIANNGAVGYAGGIGNPDFLSRISGSSGSLVILNSADAATNINFSDAPATGATWGSMGLGAAQGSFTYSGTLTPQGQTWRLGGGNGTLTFGQAITDRNGAAANLTFNSGAGMLILTSTGNTYTGETKFIEAGTVRSGVTNALSVVTTVTFSSSHSVFDLSGFDQTLAGIKGFGVITSSAGAPTLSTNLAVNSTYSGVISGTMSLFKTGTATLTLAGPLSYAGATTVQSGALVINGSSNILHSITGGGLVHLAQNRQLTADALSFNALQVDAGAIFHIRPNQAAASQLGALTLAADTNGTFTARLELADSPLILQTGTENKAATLAMLQSAVATGGAGVVGITSSTTLADVSHKATVVVDNALLHLTTFGGVAVNDNALLVEATWFGDSNLDRKVNVTDLGVLATNYGGPTALGPVGGDFNSDGVVNVTDLGLLATNYGAGTTGQPFSVTADLAAYPALAAAVPEPASLGVLSLAAIVVVRRGVRRR